VGKICGKGKFSAWSERVGEFWMERVVSRSKKRCNLCKSLEQVCWNRRDWYEVAEEKPGVDFRDDVKHIEKNDQLPED